MVQIRIRSKSSSKNIHLDQAEASQKNGLLKPSLDSQKQELYSHGGAAVRILSSLKDYDCYDGHPSNSINKFTVRVHSMYVSCLYCTAIVDFSCIASPVEKCWLNPSFSKYCFYLYQDLGLGTLLLEEVHDGSTIQATSLPHVHTSTSIRISSTANR